MIPGELEVDFNIRYNPHWDAPKLETEITALLDRHGLQYALKWHRSGEPFYTPEGTLRATARAVLAEHIGRALRKAPVAAPPMHASSRRWVRSASKWGQSTPASTRWMRTCAWMIWKRCRGFTSAWWNGCWREAWRRARPGAPL